MTSDPGPKIPPEKLSYKLQGANKDTFHTLLQKRDGTFLLILWQEVSSWDPRTMTAKRVVGNPINLTLAGPHRFVSLSTFDPAGQITSKAMMGAVTTSVLISDQLSVLTLK